MPGDGYTEAEAAWNYLTEAGVPPEAIVTENAASDTWESMQGVAALLQPLGVDEVIVVSDGFHLFRSRMMARDVGLQAWGSPAERAPSAPAAAASLAYVLREAAAVVAHLWQTRVDQSPASSCRERIRAPIRPIRRMTLFSSARTRSRQATSYPPPDRRGPPLSSSPGRAGRARRHHRCAMDRSPLAELDSAARRRLARSPAHSAPLGRAALRMTMIFLSIMTLFAVQLVRVQVVMSDSITHRVGVDPATGDVIANPLLIEEALTTPRGTIHDRDGVILARTVFADGVARRVYPNRRRPKSPGTSRRSSTAHPGWKPPGTTSLPAAPVASPWSARSNGLRGLPRAGIDLHLTLDAALQRQAHEALGDRAGAAVLLDVDSGAVLALASGPSFDPNALVVVTEATARRRKAWADADIGSAFAARPTRDLRALSARFDLQGGHRRGGNRPGGPARDYLRRRGRTDDGRAHPRRGQPSQHRNRSTGALRRRSPGRSTSSSPRSVCSLAAMRWRRRHAAGVGRGISFDLPVAAEPGQRHPGFPRQSGRGPGNGVRAGRVAGDSAANGARRRRDRQRR